MKIGHRIILKVGAIQVNIQSRLTSNLMQTANPTILHYQFTEAPWQVTHARLISVLQTKCHICRYTHYIIFYYQISRMNNIALSDS